jgi:carbamoyl-phosphate synthase large subunit
LEVVRDAKGQKITVCFIENVDPVGVHTGDSFCVAPMLTISKEVQAELQDYSYRILDAIGVTGGCNVQFARNRNDGRVIVIEINPRTSRSSALASKATGFPIAKVSTVLATGVTLDELPYYRDGSLEKYTPSGDYVVAKFARWAFEKFPQAKDALGTQMKAVGEVMSIGKDFKEAFQKAIRSLEIGRSGPGCIRKIEALTLDELRPLVSSPSSERFFHLYEAFKKGLSVDEAFKMTSIAKFFLGEIQELALFELDLNKYTFLLIANVLLIIIGMFMEGGPAMMILGPLLMPIALKLGIDPIQFGIMFVFNLGIGNMTPPFGVVLYQVSSLMGLRFTKVAKATIPFIGIMLLVLAIIVLCPKLILFLPNLLYG